jgi:transcriptional regulator with XRE-family HTH domain
MSNKLKELRKAKHLTLDDVANLCGVTSQTVSRWELGQTVISDDRYEQLAVVYGVDVDALKQYVEGNGFINQCENCGEYLKMELAKDDIRMLKDKLLVIRGYEKNPKVDAVVDYVFQHLDQLNERLS